MVKVSQVGTDLKSGREAKNTGKKLRSRQSKEQNEEFRLNKQQNGGNVLCREQIEGTDIQRIKWRN
jgi:hypothetical protein